MTRAPFVVGKSNEAWSRKGRCLIQQWAGGLLMKSLRLCIYPYTMGETAENVAEQWNISREEQDAFAFQSQEKYFAAKDAGKFNNEIAAVEIHNKGLINWVIVDEHPRKTSLEKLAVLKPAFKKDGTVTAGNSSA
jgi:acetyl-CoA C-acetyltransferase